MYTMADLDGLKTVEEYRALLQKVTEEANALFDEWDPRPFPPDEQTRFAAMTELAAELKSRIAERDAKRKIVDELMKDEAAKDKPFSGRTIVTPPKHVPDDIFAVEQYRNLNGSEEQLLQSYRDGAMFAVERATYFNPQSRPDVEQGHIARLLDTADLPSKDNPNRELSRRILATGSPEYLRAFTRYIQTGNMDQRAVAPWTVQTDATGGYAVPFYFDPTLLHTGAWTNVNPYRQACRVITIVGTDTYNAPTTTNFTVARAAEATAATEGLGAVGQISAIVGKVQGVGTVSIELLQDRPDVVSEIATLIAEAKDTEEESIFSVGAGDALGAGYNPIGMFGAVHTTTGAYTHIDTAAAAGAVAAADAYAVEAALPIRHRANAAWFMNRGVIRVWQALETTGGQLFGGVNYNSVGTPANSPSGNTGLRLIGYPIWECPSAPAFVAATDDLVISCLCDPKSYYIIERAGMSVEVIPHFLSAATGYPTGQRMIYAWWRNTAKPANVDAGRRLALLA